MGLVHLLQAVRNCASVRRWSTPPPTRSISNSHRRGYREEHPLGGHDPYSTSKACAELVSACYRKAFSPVGKARHSLGYGARRQRDRRRRLVGGSVGAGFVRAASTGSVLNVRNPDAVRPWQHVLEPLSGYLRLGQGLLAGEAIEGAWNFGPTADATLPVHALIARMQAYWPSLRSECQPGAHPHEAEMLRLDCSKARREFGWQPSLERGYHSAAHRANGIAPFTSIGVCAAPMTCATTWMPHGTPVRLGSMRFTRRRSRPDIA